MSRPRLVIVDDHEDLRCMLRNLLGEEYNVVGEGASGLDAIEQSELHTPDLLLLDVSMPGMSGFEAARILRERLPSLLIVLVTQHVEAAYASEANRIGVQGYVLKRRIGSELRRAIEEVLRGGRFRSPAIAA